MKLIYLPVNHSLLWRRNWFARRRKDHVCQEEPTNMIILLELKTHLQLLEFSTILQSDRLKFFLKTVYQTKSAIPNLQYKLCLKLLKLSEIIEEAEANKQFVTVISLSCPSCIDCIPSFVHHDSCRAFICGWLFSSLFSSTPFASFVPTGPSRALQK